MNAVFNARGRLWICLVAGMLAGCTAGSSGTIPVTGKVTKGGQPVSGAAVTFAPGATDGKPAAGTTDASGVYKLTTFVNGDGALPGSYKVTITKFPGAETPGVEAGKVANPQDVDAIYKSMEKQGKNVLGRPTAPPKEAANEIAAKFARTDTSGLTAEVKAGATNAFDFDVTEK